MRHVIQRRKAFTLMEMLLVITIIVVLAGLLLPALRTALQKAEQSQAKTEAAQLATALRAFRAEYGTWPASMASGQGSISAAVIQILTGEDTVSNPRRHVFFEPNAKSLQGSPSLYVDPWGSAFRYILDADYDGSITLNGQRLPSTALVWSYGPKGTSSTTNEWVKTW